MKSNLMRIVGRLLILTMLALPFQTVQAGMIGTDQIAASGGAAMQRANLLGTMSRPDVASQLQSLGVDPASAKARVDAMTDAEVQSLAGKLGALPAGADSSGWGWAILIALVIWAWYSYR
ncbi:MAG TPA: PA2779 family protein [Rhodocyclaceae bacterium]